MEQSIKSQRFGVGGKPIELDIPIAEMDSGYLSSFYRTLGVLAGTLSNVEDEKDVRIPLITDFLVALIPDDLIRSEVKQLKKTLSDDRVQALKDSGAKITNEAMGKIVREVNMDIVGEVVSYFDQFAGLSHKLSIGDV